MEEDNVEGLDLEVGSITDVNGKEYTAEICFNPKGDTPRAYDSTSAKSFTPMVWKEDA